MTKGHEEGAKRGGAKPDAAPRGETMGAATLDPMVAGFLTYLNAMPRVDISELTASALRAQFSALGQLADVPVGEVAVIRNLRIPVSADSRTTIGGRLFDARTPEARRAQGPGPVVVFFHGGGFVIGDLDSYAPLCAEMARVLDLPVVSVDYRLAPEFPFPNAAQDAAAAARWVATAPEALEIGAVTGLVLAGDSAGGNLTITTALALRDRPAAVPVLAQCPIYPVVDARLDWPSQIAYGEGHFLTLEGIDWFYKNYAPVAGDARFDVLAQDPAGLPPTLIVTAGFDPLRDQGAAYARALQDADVPTHYVDYASMIHGFISMRRAIPPAGLMLADLLGRLRSLIAASTAGAGA